MPALADSHPSASSRIERQSVTASLKSAICLIAACRAHGSVPAVSWTQWGGMPPPTPHSPPSVPTATTPNPCLATPGICMGVVHLRPVHEQDGLAGQEAGVGVRVKYPLKGIASLWWCTDPGPNGKKATGLQQHLSLHRELLPLLFRLAL